MKKRIFIDISDFKKLREENCYFIDKSLIVKEFVEGNRKEGASVIPFQSEIDRIKEAIVEKYNPKAIYLFGSCAKGCARGDSDIDLCIVMPYEDKRKTRIEIDEYIQSDKDIDFVLYSPEAWKENAEDSGSFANLILRTGVKLYG